VRCESHRTTAFGRSARPVQTVFCITGLRMFGYSQLGYRVSRYQRLGGHRSRSAIQSCDPCAHTQSRHDIHSDSRSCTRRPFLVDHLGDGDSWDCGSARLSDWNCATRRNRMTRLLPMPNQQQPKRHTRCDFQERHSGFTLSHFKAWPYSVAFYAQC
jgi:hypothetical protein